MRIILDGSAIRTESDLHDALAGPLDFGPYYGRNLSALWDRLTVDVERPVELIWRKSQESRRSMGEEAFEKLASLLRSVMEQDESFGLTERFTVRFE